MSAAQTLRQALFSEAMREDTLAAAEALVDKEVAAKTGIAGMAVRSGYRVVRAVRPGILREVLEALLPEFCDALSPFYDRAREGHGDDEVPRAFEQVLLEAPGDVARALLAVTDARAERAKNKVLRKTYAKLRGSALDHVAAAVPNLARTLRDLLAASQAAKDPAGPGGSPPSEG